LNVVVHVCTGDVGEYQVPYQNCVPNDPSIEDMKKIVVTQEIRPGIDERWNNHEVIATLCLLCAYMQPVQILAQALLAINKLFSWDSHPPVTYTCGI
jgi:hypothetical protein